jgi:hypothetical protein
MAPGRFTACINQAPLKRRTLHRWLRLYDVAANAVGTFRHAREIPPDQLLRRAFEECRDYVEARRLLEGTPVARPVIYTLAGCRPGERCVIERTEAEAVTREADTSAANDWLPSRSHWEGRLGVEKFLISSFEEAAGYSRARREGLDGWPGTFGDGSFGWVTPPVLNPFTRQAVEMCAARGIMRVVGYERAAGDALPSPATESCEVVPERLAA